MSSHSIEVIYKTYSMCPKCLFLDRSGMKMQEAVVERHNDSVFLSVKCGKHGEQNTLYCSSFRFFRNMLSYGKIASADIEDLMQRSTFKVLDCGFVFTFYQSNGKLKSVDEIKIDVAKFKELYTDGAKYLLKLEAKLCKDIEAINGAALSLADFHNGPVLLEASYERHVLLSQLDNSAYLNARIFPALKYYLQKGNEEQCENELLHLFDSLESFKNIQCVVTLVISTPYPSLRKLLQVIRARPSSARVLVLDTDRPPQQLMEDVRSNKQLSVDPAALIRWLEHEADFSGNVLQCLEPLLYQMGYGKFELSVSPFCGLMAVFVNTPTLKSVPLTKLFDVSKFYREMLPHLPKIRENKSLDLITMNRIKKAFNKSALPHKPLPNLVEYLTASSKAQETAAFIRHLQFLVIHNNMDVAAIDLARRCQCTALRGNPAGGIAAQCTGCI